jgi:hypothetical protein
MRTIICGVDRSPVGDVAERLAAVARYEDAMMIVLGPQPRKLAQLPQDPLCQRARRANRGSGARRSVAAGRDANHSVEHSHNQRRPR